MERRHDDEEKMGGTAGGEMMVMSFDLQVNGKRSIHVNKSTNHTECSQLRS